MYEFFANISAIMVVILGYIILAVIGFGPVLALIISWNRNSSLLWAIFHGWLGWFYVIYYYFRLRTKPPSVHR